MADCGMLLANAVSVPGQNGSMQLVDDIFVPADVSALCNTAMAAGWRSPSHVHTQRRAVAFTMLLHRNTDRSQTVRSQRRSRMNHTNQPHRWRGAGCSIFDVRYTHAVHERPPGLSLHCNEPRGAVQLGLPRNHRPPHYTRMDGQFFGGCSVRRALICAFDGVCELNLLGTCKMQQPAERSALATAARAKVRIARQNRHREVRAYVTQNCWGAKSESRLTQLFDGLKRRHAFAGFCQETCTAAAPSPRCLRA